MDKYTGNRAETLAIILGIIYCVAVIGYWVIIGSNRG
jgi:hypothetical protein